MWLGFSWGYVIYWVEVVVGGAVGRGEGGREGVGGKDRGGEGLEEGRGEGQREEG